MFLGPVAVCRLNRVGQERGYSRKAAVIHRVLQPTTAWSVRPTEGFYFCFIFQIWAELCEWRKQVRKWGGASEYRIQQLKEKRIH